MLPGLLKTIIDGGMLMIPLMAESVLAAGIVFDRYMAFRDNAKVDTRSLRAKILNLLVEDKVDEAALLCANTPGPVSAVILAGLQAYHKYRPTTQNPESLRVLIGDAMESYTQQAMSTVTKRLNILSFISNSAPLFGMTGTVTGMISAFAAMASAGNVSAGVVAAGISEALITTAAGLLIAMGAVIPYHYYAARAAAIETEILDAGSEILDFITINQGQKVLKAAKA